MVTDSDFSMQSEGGANHFVSIGINFGFTLLCAIPTWIVISRLEHSHEVVVQADEQTDGKLADQS
jgi:hypothetical protein